VFRSVFSQQKHFTFFLSFPQLKLISKFASTPQAVSLEKEITAVTKSRNFFSFFKKKKDVGYRKPN